MPKSTSSEAPLIEFRGVYKAYDNGTKALNDVNLKIYKGEFVFVVGASGAGKSTFIKMIMHEEKPNAGEISRPRTFLSSAAPWALSFRTSVL